MFYGIILLQTQFGQVGSLRSVVFRQFSLLVGWIRLGHSIWSGWVTQVGCVLSVLSVGWVDQAGILNLVRLGHSGLLCSISSLCWLGGLGCDTQFGQVGSLMSVVFHQISLLVGWIRLGHSILSDWVT